jgi:ABC-type transporter Mla subunit MlaD
VRVIFEVSSVEEYQTFLNGMCCESIRLNAELDELRRSLAHHTHMLLRSVRNNTNLSSNMESDMAAKPKLATTNPVLEQLRGQVEAANGAMASATVLINGIAARVQAGIDAALANGATADELAPLTDEVNSLKNASDELSAAVQANTPNVPTP